jgi:hypothetical protein
MDIQTHAETLCAAAQSSATVSTSPNSNPWE